jgi:IclR family acetate operon transcriptional repressor
VGKVLLASLSSAEVDDFIAEYGLPRLTPRTITSPEELIERLHKIRVRGYALDDEEEEMGVKCVGVPLFDHTGKVVAALSLSGLSVDFTRERIAMLAEMLKEAAAKVSHHLGYASQD